MKDFLFQFEFKNQEEPLSVIKQNKRNSLEIYDCFYSLPYLSNIFVKLYEKKY